VSQGRLSSQYFHSSTIRCETQLLAEGLYLPTQCHGVIETTVQNGHDGVSNHRND
jgi:hypothetical protein